MRIDVPPEHAHDAYAFVMSNFATKITTAASLFSKAAFEHSRLSIREFEAARQIIADINGCLLCRDFRPMEQADANIAEGGDSSRQGTVGRGDPPDSKFYREIRRRQVSDIFSPRERLAMTYAELFALQPLALAADEAFWEEMKSLFSDEEIVDLSCCLAGWLGLGRFTHVLGLDGACTI